MTEVEEVEDMREIEIMTGIEIMTEIEGMKNDVRKERRASLQRRLHGIKWGREHKSMGKLHLHS